MRAGMDLKVSAGAPRACEPLCEVGGRRRRLTRQAYANTYPQKLWISKGLTSLILASEATKLVMLKK